MSNDSKEYVPAVEGTVLHISRGKLWALFIGVLLVAPFGAFLIYVRWQEDMISITGIIFVIAGVIGTPLALLAAIYWKHCLIIGKDRIQMGDDPSKIDTEIPYSNIEDMKLFRQKDVPGSYLMIFLRDPEDPDTVMPSKEIESNQKMHGCDVKIDGFKFSAKQIRGLILDEWNPPKRRRFEGEMRG